jgi:hypothetical protein
MFQVMKQDMLCAMIVSMEQPVCCLKRRSYTLTPSSVGPAGKVYEPARMGLRESTCRYVGCSAITVTPPFGYSLHTFSI